MRPPNITYLTDIYFDFGMVSILPELLKEHSITRPLIITDSGLVKSGILDRIGINGVAVFDRVETNPTEATALEALAVYRQMACDGIVAVGGGSPMDLAKCAGLLVHHAQPPEQYSIARGGSSAITKNIPPIIAVPTTAGSGSEVGRAALLTIATGRKLGFLSEYLLPKATVCDPELTMGMPPWLTAGTGMDAISHCVETFCSNRYNPVADSIALDGLDRGYRNIQAATLTGDDRYARSAMMMCSLQGGLAFQKGLGAVHSLSHPLGALTEKRLHHGTLNAIFLPHVLRFNFDHCKDKMEAIAKRLETGSASGLPEAFAKLNQVLGLPGRLRDLGVSREDLEPLASHAMEDHCTPTNPRPLTVDNFNHLYFEAW